MKALTLWQPWASIVASGVKRIENRQWPPPANMLGQRIAIHAGQKYDHASYEKARELAPELVIPQRGACPSGAIIGTAVLVAVARTTLEAMSQLRDRAPNQARWFFGPYGWILEDIRELHAPIPYCGHQKLWTIDPATDFEIASARATLHG